MPYEKEVEQLEFLDLKGRHKMLFHPYRVMRKY